MLNKAVNRARAARTNDKGFTLIELLIVIVILGILAAIVVFSVQGITNRGNLAACKADVASVTTAEEAFYAQQASSPAYSTVANVQTDLVPKYLHAWPTGTTITYALAAGGFTVTGNNGGQTC